MAEAIPAPDKATTELAPTCYKCGTLLAPEAPDVCAACGRRQTRQCFCGTKISRGLAICPTCGADWSHIRRRSRSSRKRINTRELLLNAFIGGLGAVALAGVLYFLLAGGAQSIAEAVASTASTVWSGVSPVVSRAAVPAAVFLVGCLLGVGRYCANLRSRRTRRSRERSKER